MFYVKCLNCGKIMNLHSSHINDANEEVVTRGWLNTWNFTANKNIILCEQCKTKKEVLTKMMNDYTST